MGRAVLFLNGDINLSFCESFLSGVSDLSIFCADGAFEKIKGSSELVDNLKAVMGDFDSFDNHQNLPKGVQKLHFEDQNYTDFEKSLSYLSKRYSHIDVFGANGGEVDHSLGNISVSINWLDRLNIRLIDQYGVSFFAEQKFSKNEVLGKTVSIMPLPKMTNVHYQGLQYLCEGQDLEFGQKTGIRNHAIEGEINIKCETGKFMVYISHNLSD